MKPSSVDVLCYCVVLR